MESSDGCNRRSREDIYVIQVLESPMNRKKIIHLVNHFEAYLACFVFIILTLLLAVQVISRYFFHHSLTWTEEVSGLLFVVFGYLTTASAVTERKHLRIDVLLESVPSRCSKFLYIFSDVVFIGFNMYIWIPFIRIIDLMKGSRTPILGIPRWPFYLIIPILLTVTSIRCIQDIVRLIREDEKSMGQSVPLIDLGQYEEGKE